jgi:hypothetical protein
VPGDGVGGMEPVTAGPQPATASVAARASRLTSDTRWITGHPSYDTPTIRHSARAQNGRS